MSAPHASLERLITAMAHAHGHPEASTHTASPLAGVRLENPTTLSEALAGHLPGWFTLTGSLDRRLLIAARGDGSGEFTIADLSGQPHNTRSWPEWAAGHINLDTPADWLTTGHLTAAARHRLERPRVLLTALYHPEFFPLPRFPLGISDLARAVRTTLLGQVRLLDMQLGTGLEEIGQAVADWRPDIVGISATFGQHDLLTALLDALYATRMPPLVVAGGSLTARNEAHLLDRYPHLLISRGAGEPTIADLVAHFHADLDLSDIRGIGYAGAARGGGLSIARPRGHRRTATVANRDGTQFLPELDLLDATFDHQGVAQLEASRGCTNFCSFCPRGHKGSWAGADADGLPWMLDAMGAVFDRHPDISRTVYLVDEEFIGRGPDAVGRALRLGEQLHTAGFRWESSCRVDQVADPNQDRAWHLERAGMWRQLVAHGLRRMLFGVESGVTSILERFNKETTAEQNALAIRTLSALGVPTRFTYITFDHLMDLSELKATHAFQARTDLLLRPLPELSVEQIVDGVHDEDFVTRHSLGRPFYTGVSYLLVSMECLIGAAYTRRVQAQGLAGATRLSMGRVDADFLDWRIGRCSQHAQLWVDRQFALDYTLKSLEKLLDDRPRQLVRNARVVIKDAAFALLTQMIALVTATGTDERDAEQLDARLRQAMDDRLRLLAAAMDDTLAAILPELPDTAASLLRHEHERWARASTWQLINAADPCGT